MHSSPDLNASFDNNNANFTHIVCVKELNTVHVIMLYGVDQGTEVNTQTKKVKKLPKIPAVVEL